MAGKHEPGGPHALDPQELLQTLSSFVQAESWSESRRVLDSHPELLSAEAERLLAILIQEAERQGDEKSRRGLELRRTLLQRCREVGVERAFLEQTEVAAEDTTNELEAILQQLDQLTRPSDMPRRISLCHQALSRVSKEQQPQLWAKLQIELANSLSQTPQGNRAENIELAIEYSNKALEVYTRDAFPQEWAQTQNNLAESYYHRIRGERAENIELVIKYCRKALEVLTREAFPHDWAQIQNNLAVAYADRFRGKRAENIELSIKHYKNALKVRTRDAFPQLWAQTQNNLANAYSDRFCGKRTKNIERAIKLYKKALKVLTREAFPHDWAQIQNNLANAYSDRFCGKRTKNIERAIKHYQNALEVFTPDAFPQEWANTQNNLANAYSDRIRGERAENIELAIEQYKSALEVFTPDAFPHKCRRTASALSGLAFAEQRWRLTVESYRTAAAAQERLLAAALSRTGKQTELGELQGLPARAAFACMRLQQHEQAVEILEAGRAQLLREALERQRRDLHALAGGTHDEQYRAYETALQELQEWQALRAEHQPADWGPRLSRAQQRLQQAIETLRAQVPGFAHFLRSLPFAEIRQQASDAPLVYLAATEHGSMALVVRAEGEPEAVTLADVTGEILRKKVYIPAKNSHPGGYLGAYMTWRDNPRDRGSPTAWFSALDETLLWLGERVMGPLVAHLQQTLPEGAVVRLIPGGLFGLLPLHAARLPTPEAATPTYALDAFCFTFAPSAQALSHARRAAARPAHSLLAVDNPDSSLEFSRYEVAAALQFFDNPTHLPNGSATVEQVRAVLGEHEVLHFSTHGTAGWTDAEQSQLLLADGVLTLRDMFALRLQSPRLAVLSACETGVPGLERADEAEGLPSGLMQAGVPGVLGSLWPVNDLSTAMLMARFYELWREQGLPPHAALRRAQCWLRDARADALKAQFKKDVPQFAGTRQLSVQSAEAFFGDITLRFNDDAHPFAHPYYWAGFAYTGL